MSHMESSVEATPAPAPKQGLFVAALLLLRPHQWSKNVLLVIPFLLSHQPQYLNRWPLLLLAVVAFCLAASGGYIANDLHDLASDRAHPRKRSRPIAAGLISVPLAIVMLVVLLVAAISISLVFLPLLFSDFLAAYIILTLTYTLVLKARLLIDVFMLAILYCLRLLAGGAAIGLTITPWLLAFTVFLFLSLAFVKRYTELALASDNEVQHLRSRNYRIEDMPMIATFGAVSGYLAVLLFAVYLNTDLARAQYAQPRLLWLVGFILLYWITRIWFIAVRRELSDDPVTFALRDRISWVAGMAAVVVTILAATVNQ